MQIVLPSTIGYLSANLWLPKESPVRTIALITAPILYVLGQDKPSLLKVHPVP